MIVEEEWKHKICRSPKDGHPTFDGKKWICSRCGCGYVVSIEGATQDEADEMFEKYLIEVCFVRIYRQSS